MTPELHGPAPIFACAVKNLGRWPNVQGMVINPLSYLVGGLDMWMNSMVYGRYNELLNGGYNGL